MCVTGNCWWVERVIILCVFRTAEIYIFITLVSDLFFFFFLSSLPLTLISYCYTDLRVTDRLRLHFLHPAWWLTSYFI